MSIEAFGSNDFTLTKRHSRLEIYYWIIKLYYSTHSKEIIVVNGQ